MLMSTLLHPQNYTVPTVCNTYNEHVGYSQQSQSHTLALMCLTKFVIHCIVME